MEIEWVIENSQFPADGIDCDFSHCDDDVCGKIEGGKRYKKEFRKFVGGGDSLSIDTTWTDTTSHISTSFFCGGSVSETQDDRKTRW
jgi:hypothetical protein